MVTLTQLWLPVLLSAVFVFIVSSIVHMATPMHKGDFRKVPGEEKVLAELRNQGIEPGCYMFPFADSMKECGSPEMLEKCKRGPVGFLTITPSGAPGMGKNLVQWFLFCILVGVFVAYVGTIATARGAGFLPVFRLTGTVAIMGYALGSFPDGIWKGTKWSVVGKFVIDGVLYGLTTGATFGWLWPGA
ncbi:MAG: hypothetical protein HY763_01220 [Planctomycetes bacterium]|nr:hypothetical protein [Planctomycetota bacterium]